MTRTTAVRSRRVAALALGVALALTATACGDDADTTATSEPTATQAPVEETSPTDEPTDKPTEEAPDEAIQVTFDGDTVRPNGDRVKATAGERIVFAITADAPGELHVHSTPEQVLAYKAGKSRLSLMIDTPGVVEVESHELGLIVVQLEVR